jgi:hypothetical protein
MRYEIKKVALLLMGALSIHYEWNMGVVSANNELAVIKWKEASRKTTLKMVLDITLLKNSIYVKIYALN